MQVSLAMSRALANASTWLRVRPCSVPYGPGYACLKCCLIELAASAQAQEDSEDKLKLSRETASLSARLGTVTPRSPQL